jgi:Chaperone for flagella basal body P-ring formation
MRNARCFHVICLYITLFALQGMFIVRSARAACYSTPRAALEAFVANSRAPTALKKDGYQVTGIESDSVLGRRWATIASCSHPEWPVFAVPAPGGRSVVVAPPEMQRSLTENAARTPLVRAGDIVRLWRQENLLRIEVAGISEESGGSGQTIRVRLLRSNRDNQSIPEQYSGVIRGPSDVEMEP